MLGTKGDGVFKSTNGGENWSAVNTGLSSYAYVYSLAIAPATPSTLYVVAYDGVFKSTDGGRQWNTVDTGLNSGLNDMEVSSLVIDPVTSTTLYAVTSVGGLFKSMDGGESWSAINTGLSDSDVSNLLIDPASQTRYMR